jgi:hypothetical protein
MMFLVHQLLCERSSILSFFFSFFPPLVPSVVRADNKSPSHSTQDKVGQPGRSAKNLLLQIRKTNLLLVQFRGELAALARRSKRVSQKSSLRHVAEIVAKMKKCTFLESTFLLASCKFVDDLQMGTPADHGSR